MPVAAVAAVGAGMGVAGTVMQVNANEADAQAKSDLAKREAMLKEQQAFETMYRAKLYEKEITRNVKKVQSEQVQFFAGSGRDQMLLQLEETADLGRQQIYNSYHEANFRANLLHSGAESDLASLGAIRKATENRNIAAVLSSGGSILGGLSGMMGGSGSARPASMSSNQYGTLSTAPTSVNYGGGSYA